MWCVWGEEQCLDDLVGKPEGQSPFGRLQPMWVDNIAMDLKQVRRDGVNCINSTKGRNNWWALSHTVIRFYGNS
jgi:hypothetical protein